MRFIPTDTRFETELLDMVTVRGGKVVEVVEFADTQSEGVGADPRRATLTDLLRRNGKMPRARRLEKRAAHAMTPV